MKKYKDFSISKLDICPGGLYSSMRRRSLQQQREPTWGCGKRNGRGSKAEASFF